MNTPPLLPFLDHLWQSTAFAVVAGLLTLAMRKDRARVRHGLWLVASVKFLVPLSVLIAAGSRVPWPKVQHTAASNWSVAIMGLSEPFTEPIVTTRPLATPIRPAANQIAFDLFAVWACGFLGIACSWGVRWRRLAAVVLTGSPVELNLPIPAIISPTLIEPGVFGLFRPVLLLPAGILEQLTPAQLRAVIAHELCHVRHRDNFTSAFHMFVETTFWFHPMVWWIGKRMVEERELACDEAVLNTGSDPRVYAEALLNVCKLFVEPPLRCASGITGANLKRRIEVMMTRQIHGDLHVAKKLALAAAGMAALIMPILIGMIHSRPARAQSGPAAVAQPVTLLRESSHTANTANTPQVAAQSVAQAEPHFNPVPSPEEERKIRAAYAKANFTNRGMAAAYTEYGPPDRIEDQESGTRNAIQIWRYNYLEAYRGSAEFEFAPQSLLAARIEWPPQERFEGATQTVSAADPAWVETLKREMGQSEQTATTANTGLSGRHASIQPSIRLSPSTQLFNLSLPLDNLSGRVDIVGHIVQILDSGADVPAVSNVRDYIQAAPGANLIYRTVFAMAPGSYVCHLLVREQATGLMYTEAIGFHVK